MQHSWTVTISRKTLIRATLIGASLGAISLFGAPALHAYLGDARGQPPLPQVSKAYDDQKVVYHVSQKGSFFAREAEAWRLMAVLRNHLRAVEPANLDLRVIVQGDGIDLLKRAKASPSLHAAFLDLRDRGVRFAICRNTLSAYKVGIDDLPELGEGLLVPSGVVELVHLQQQGYSYIKF